MALSGLISDQEIVPLDSVDPVEATPRYTEMTCRRCDTSSIFLSKSWALRTLVSDQQLVSVVSKSGISGCGFG